MRNLKKLLAVIVAICVLATFTVPAFAAETPVYGTQAATLNTLGLYDGILLESFDPDLGTAVDRQTGITLLVKMLGKKDAALAMSEAAQNEALSAFIDLDDLVAWAKPYMAYAIANGLSNGMSSNTVGPKAAMTGNMFATLMLRNLGYTVTDFTTGLATLSAKGGLTSAQVTAFNKELTKDEIVGISFGSLSAVDSDGKLLIEVLIADGVVTEAAAIAAGVYAAELKVEVKATAANEITLTFNKAIDTAKTVISAKLGFVPQDVTVKYADDKKSATLTSEDNFIAGDYTVTVDDVVTALKIEAQKLVSFTIATTSLTAEGVAQPLKYAAVDQYGKTFDYAPTNFQATAFNITQNAAVNIVNGTNEFTITTVTLAKDDKVLVTLVHKTDGISQSATFTVGAEKAVDAITFGTPEPKTDNARIYVSDVSEDLVMPMTLKDQYGNDVTATSAVLSNDVIFISSATGTVDPADFTVVDGKVYYKTGATAGKVTLTAIAKKTGKTATVTFEVYAIAALASVQLQQPTGLIVATEAVTVNYVGKDTYGDAKKLALLTDLVWFSSNPLIVDKDTDISVSAKGVLTITPKIAGTVTISAFLGGVKQGDVVITAKDAAVATKITKLADGTITYFSAAGGTKTYGNADFVIVDQYNRAIATADLAGTIAITAADAAVVSTTGGAVTAVAAGTKTLTATYTDGAIVLTKTFTATVIADSAVVGYQLANIANKTLLVSVNPLYAKTFVIENGLDAAGNKVALSVADAANFVLTTSSTAVDINVATVTAITKDATAIVAAWKKGVKIGEVTFTTSDAVSVIDAVAFKEASYTIAVAGTVNLAAEFKADSVVDQYGVAVPGVPAGTYFSANSAIASVSGSTVTGVAAGEVNVTFVTAKGVFTTVKIIVE